MRFLKKAADCNYSSKLPDLFSLFLSLTVDTQLINSLQGSKHKDLHFYLLNAEMIGILKQLKCTSTEIEISQTGHKGMGEKRKTSKACVAFPLE